jgi:hypothetical protein
MLYREIIAICSEIHTKHINALCGQNVEIVNVKPGGTYSNHWALNFRSLPKYNYTRYDKTQRIHNVHNITAPHCKNDAKP